MDKRIYTGLLRPVEPNHGCFYWLIFNLIFSYGVANSWGAFVILGNWDICWIHLFPFSKSQGYNGFLFLYRFGGYFNFPNISVQYLSATFSDPSRLSCPPRWSEKPFFRVCWCWSWLFNEILIIIFSIIWRQHAWWGRISSGLSLKAKVCRQERRIWLLFVA